MTATYRINGYRITPCTPDSVGDWQGQEQRACDQFTLVREAIARAWPENNVEQDLQGNYEEVCQSAWDNLGSEPDLLTYTAKDIARVAAKYVA